MSVEVAKILLEQTKALPNMQAELETAERESAGTVSVLHLREDLTDHIASRKANRRCQQIADGQLSLID